MGHSIWPRIHSFDSLVGEPHLTSVLPVTAIVGRFGGIVFPLLSFPMDHFLGTGLIAINEHGHPAPLQELDGQK